MTDMEDRCRRNNVRLVGLPEGMGRSRYKLSFLRANLPSGSFLEGPWHWDWSGASRVWRREGLRSAAHSHLPCTERAHDRSDIWKVLGRLIRWSAHRTMSHCCFFPTLVRLTAIRRKAFGPVLKKMTALGLQPFLSIQRWLTTAQRRTEKLRFPSESGGFYSVPCLSRSLCRSSAGGRRGSSGRCSPSPREGHDGREDLALAAQKGMIAGWPWMLAKPIVCVFFSLYWDIVLYYPVQRSLCW